MPLTVMALSTLLNFYVDGQLVVIDSSEPYQFNWNAAVGSHTFKAKAIDNDNLSTLSQEVTLTVGSGSNAGCAGLPVYSVGTAYSAGQLVQNKNQKYRCDIVGWCSSSSVGRMSQGLEVIGKKHGVV